MESFRSFRGPLLLKLVRNYFCCFLQQIGSNLKMIRLLMKYINNINIRLVLVNNNQCAKPCERMQDLLRRLSLVQRAAATVQCTSVVFPFRVRNFGKINSRDLQFLCLPCPRSNPGISEASWLTSICSPMGATRGQKRRDSK